MYARYIVNSEQHENIYALDVTGVCDPRKCLLQSTQLSIWYV